MPKPTNRDLIVAAIAAAIMAFLPVKDGVIAGVQAVSCSSQ